jgi:hypothetical protein
VGLAVDGPHSPGVDEHRAVADRPVAVEFAEPADDHQVVRPREGCPLLHRRPGDVLGQVTRLLRPREDVAAVDQLGQHDEPGTPGDGPPDRVTGGGTVGLALADGEGELTHGDGRHPPMMPGLRPPPPLGPSRPFPLNPYLI